MSSRIISINISKEKGTTKTPVDSIDISEKGIVGDAHSGDWHRQVSILSSESISAFNKQYGMEANYGDFAENITTEGIDFKNIKTGDLIETGNVILEVTQIGKKCHGTGCAVFLKTGNCVMPKEGIFCRVISPGRIEKGDPVRHRSTNKTDNKNLTA